MRFYFQLQLRRIARYFRETGVHPLIGIVLATVLFISISLLLFEKLESGVYIYACLALFYMISLSKSARINFLKNTFTQQAFRLIRAIENVLMFSPFAVMLLVHNDFAIAAVLFLCSLLLSLLRFGGVTSLVLPTPFGKHPFEFARGFRQFLWLFVLVYILTVISLIVGNYNLGVFSLALIYLASLSFYNKPEPLYFVWIHSADCESFLKGKMIHAVKHVTLLAIPVAIVLIILCPQNTLITMALVVVGPLYTVLSLLAKYAYYPSEINIIPGFSIALCIVIPPLIIFAIPFFYRQARHNLRLLLL